MNLLLRFLIVMLRAGLAPRRRGREVLEESVLRFRVWPHDLDLNGHMNNGRYLTLMDLGRLDLLVRSGLFEHARKRRWMPVIGSAMIRYRRQLHVWQRFELHTRIVCWDDKWFTFEQRLVRDGALCALALIRGLFRTRAGNVPPGETLEAVGFDGVAPEIPAYVTAWADADARANEAAASAS